MVEVILLRGLPASGKSTLAREIINTNPNAWKRINRDELRLMFDNGITSPGAEKFIKKIRNLLIIEALTAGKHVIVDDNNLSPRTVAQITHLVQEFEKNNNVQVKITVREMEATLAECIERDKNRGEKMVGEKVIREMHRQFFDDHNRYVAQDTLLPRAVLCDLDGTLALLNGRHPYNAALCVNDVVNEPVRSLLDNYRQLDHKVILLSGRSGEFRPQTESWLAAHQIQYDQLIMREAADIRKDSIVKRELYEKEVKDRYFVAFVLDDRNQVVNMWRDELQLPCFQVYYGDF